MHRQPRARQRVGGAEAVITEIAVSAALPAVAAAAGDEVDEPAEGPAEFGLTAGADDLQLVERLDADRNAAQARRVVIRRDAVEDEAVGEIALAADRQADAG